MTNDEQAGWISAGPAGSGQAVQMRRVADTVEVREGGTDDGPVLRFTLAEWAAWLDGAKSGEFDHLS